MQVGRGRGVASVLSVVLLVGVVVILGIVLAVGAMAMLPETSEPRPQADFRIDRSNGAIRVAPAFMEDGTRFALKINGQRVYTWIGGRNDDVRRLRCLDAGDRVSVTSLHDQERRTYVIEDLVVQVQTDCTLTGIGSRFAYAQVGGRTVPLTDERYSFGLSIDPNGPNSVNGDTTYPASNPWNYVQRYDREVEGLQPPVYVVVFADNVADWDAEPTESDRQAIANSYHVDSNGNLNPTPGGSEPTNDVYMVFQPGCQQSQFKYVTKDAAYDNHILLNGQLLFVADGSSLGTTYSAPGVQCT